jgi:arsenite oxidase small subunit
MTRITRRGFIRISSVSAAALVPGVAHPQPSEKPKDYPVATIAELKAIKVDTPIAFTYPDASSPAILVRLKHAAAKGIGPGNAIVAFSTLCTHKGCPVAYRPERALLICPCHWSSFDPAKAGQMVIGQGSEALAQVVLRLQGEAIQATGLEGLVYGRHTNIL